MKHLTIFCDGTWNSPDETEKGVPCPTNVVKFANAIKPETSAGVRQCLYYDKGIGTEGGKLHQVFDGATGTGISENIKQAFRFIINNYESGDQLYFFGFSRGAFTVRSLAGFIRNCGILKKNHEYMIDDAYSLYRTRSKHPTDTESVLFRRTYAVEEEVKIKFIGVWDTVGALGNPLFLKGVVSHRNEFHDTDLSSKVENAYHALAIDERRKNFQAALWHQQGHSKNQILEQMWFAGVHSDVGGGYPEHELSDIPLLWLMEKASNHGLEFDINSIKPSPNPDPNEPRHESYKSFYKIYYEYYRPIGVIDKDKGPTNEKIHPSVKKRYKNDPNYRPKNLVDYFNRYPEERP